MQNTFLLKPGPGSVPIFRSEKWERIPCGCACNIDLGNFAKVSKGKIMPLEKGLLLLKHIPPEKIEEVTAYLSQYVRGDKTKTEDIQKLLKKTPVILKKNVSKKEVSSFIKDLTALGAEVVFVPQKEDETINSSPIDKGQKYLKKNDRKHHKYIEVSEENVNLERKEKGISKEKDKILEKIFHEESEEHNVTKIILRNNLRDRVAKELYKVNKELWLVLSLVILVALTNFLIDSQNLLLSLYYLPTVISAYFFGKRHATLTALASILLVILMVYYIPGLVEGKSLKEFFLDKWRELAVWGGSLIITAYAMGTLYDRYKEKIKELKKTYHGVLLILRHFISKDEYTENHCYRVSVYAAKIAQYLGLTEEQIEDLRAAALIHDIGKLKVSREILYKAAKLTQEEFEEMKRHVTSATELLNPLQGTFGRIIPIILAHHEKYDGSGYLGLKGHEIPLEAKILAVADVYDALISDRPYKKGLPPFEAKEIIVKGAGTHFDPQVVAAFVQAFEAGEMDVPHIMI